MTFNDYWNDYKKDLTNKEPIEIALDAWSAAMNSNLGQVIGKQHLTDKEMQTLSTRIIPSLYDIDLDGAINCKGDVLRKLRIIFNDIIDRRNAPSPLDEVK
jgi:hypothetical protein